MSRSSAGNPPRPRTDMPVVLVTGFEPFQGVDDNPSQHVVRALDGTQLLGHAVVGRVLPVVFDAAGLALKRAIRELQPVLVLALGVAPSRDHFSVEKVALNWRDARVPDNAGQQPLDAPVVRGGPVACFSTLPVKAMVQALQRRGFAAELSTTAGSFLCNDVFYTLMRTGARRPGLRAGFMHLPPSAGAAGVGLERQTQAVVLALRTALATRTDVRVAAGHVD